MKGIVFLHLSAPLLAGAKTCTRRGWSARYAKDFTLNEMCEAYNRRPERGGIKLAVIRIVGFPRLELDSAMPDSDYEAEGFRWLYGNPDCIPATIGGQPASRANFSWEAFEQWRSMGGSEYVIRFSLIEIFAKTYVEDLRAKNKHRSVTVSPLLFPERELREWERG